MQTNEHINRFPRVIVTTKEGKDIVTNRIRNYCDGGIYMDDNDIVYLTDVDNVVVDSMSYIEFCLFLSVGNLVKQINEQTQLPDNE